MPVGELFRKIRETEEDASPGRREKKNQRPEMSNRVGKKRVKE